MGGKLTEKTAFLSLWEAGEERIRRTMYRVKARTPLLTTLLPEIGGLVEPSSSPGRRLRKLSSFRCGGGDGGGGVCVCRGYSSLITLMV